MSRTRAIVFLAVFICIIPLLVPVVMRLIVADAAYSSVDDVPQSRVAVVLGASVVRGEPSPTLAKRADAAVELFNAGKVEFILITGDNGSNDYDEVTPVQNYMVEKGVPEDKIFLDSAGFDTYSSMYRAINTFAADTLTVVTQDFHLPRALFIAQSLGAEAYGLKAEGEESSIQNYLREIPASNKAVIDLISGRFKRLR
jgi:SanA protein